VEVLARLVGRSDGAALGCIEGGVRERLQPTTGNGVGGLAQDDRVIMGRHENHKIVFFCHRIVFAGPGSVDVGRSQDHS